MAVEIWNGFPTWRVFNGACVTVVEGGVGDRIIPITTRNDLDYEFGPEDIRRVEDMRQWWARYKFSQVVEPGRLQLKFSKVKGPTEFDVKCQVVTKTHVEQGDLTILNVTDGTESPLRVLKRNEGNVAPNIDPAEYPKVAGKTHFCSMQFLLSCRFL